jgi:transforming growth factor-beta-induced protein
LTTLLAALDAAGLTCTLKGEGPFTVFAPTDEAFSALPEGTVEALLKDTCTLREILLYHVVDGKLTASEVVNLKSIETLQGEEVPVKVTDEGVFVGDAKIIVTDIKASNGIIHKIDAVLIPPEESPEEMDIIETAESAGNFTTLLTALDAANLTCTLKGEGPFTVFAPTDEAFAALPEGTVEALLNDTCTLREILLYHVVDGKLTAEEVVNLASIETLQGEEIPVKVTDEGVFVGDAKIIVTDIEASNGIIHVIDAVLIPPEKSPEEMDIIETAESAGNFTTLLTALDAANLTCTLKGEGPFTVFAPTDEAFAALPEGTVEALLKDTCTLREILLYHVVDGELTSEEVVNLTSIETLQGEEISVKVTDEGVFVGDAKIIVTDIEASNGIIHKIDAVLIPPKNKCNGCKFC